MYTIRYVDETGTVQEVTASTFVVYETEAGFGATEWSPESEEEVLREKRLGRRSFVFYDNGGLVFLDVKVEEPEPTSGP